MRGEEAAVRVDRALLVARLREHPCNSELRPHLRRPRIGSRLLARAEEYARGLGLSEIRLYTNAAMAENLAYYPRRGYIETHRADQDGFHRVFFRKPVSRPG